MQELFHMVEHFPYAGLFVALVLGSIGFPFPEDAVLVLCGFLISKNIVEPVPALLVAYSGVVVSDFLIFSVGRKYGRLIVTHRRFHCILSPEKLRALEVKFVKFGSILIFLGRQIFWFRAKIFLVAGIVKMSPSKFLVTDAISAIVTVGIMVTIGREGIQWLPSLRNPAIQTWVSVSVIVVILVALFLWRLKLRRQKSGVPIAAEG